MPRDDNFQGYGVATADAAGPLRVQDDPARALPGTAAAPAHPGAGWERARADHADLHRRGRGRRRRRAVGIASGRARATDDGARPGHRTRSGGARAELSIWSCADARAVGRGVNGSWRSTGSAAPRPISADRRPRRDARRRPSPARVNVISVSPCFASSTTSSATVRSSGTRMYSFAKTTPSISTKSAPSIALARFDRLTPVAMVPPTFRQASIASPPDWHMRPLPAGFKSGSRINRRWLQIPTPEDRRRLTPGPRVGGPDAEVPRCGPRRAGAARARSARRVRGRNWGARSPRGACRRCSTGAA